MSNGSDVAQTKGLLTDLEGRDALMNDVMLTESNWLRQAKFDLMRRDPVDAQNEVEALLTFARQLLVNAMPDVADHQKRGEQ